MELAGVGERSEHDGNVEARGDVERAVEILAPDVMDELAVLGVPLEDVGAHEVDERRRVRDLAKEAAPWLHLNDLDALARENAAIVERLRAQDADLVTARGETRRELIGEAFRSADTRVRALGEEKSHASRSRGKARATTRRRSRPGR